MGGIKRKNTLKRQIILHTMTVSSLIALVVILFSIALFSRFSREQLISATETNLLLVSAQCAKEIDGIREIGHWADYNPAIREYLTKPDDTNLMFEAYDELNTYFNSLPSRQYMYRVFVIDDEKKSLIQTGSQMSASRPLTVYNSDLFINEDYPYPYSRIGKDPLLSPMENEVLPVITPVYSFSDDRELLGYLYYEVSVSLLLDKLASYQGTKSEMSLFLGNEKYLISDQGSFTYQGRMEMGKNREYGFIRSKDTEVYSTHLANGRKGYLVSAFISGPDLRIAESVEGFMASEWGNFLLLLVLVVLIILLASFLLVLSMNQTINRPVLNIKRKLRAIANEDFSPDTAIECEGEFGEIGHSINELAGQVSDLIKKGKEDEKQKQSLEYRMLQSQINPHFLNNTLNSIKWMATIQKAEGISEMVTSLSRILTAVAKSPSSVCTMKEELSLLDDYFVLQSYRYAGSVKFEKNVDEKYYGILIPRFTFQPIVENAIFHGIEPKGSGTVSITARETDGGDVEFAVTDNGVGMRDEEIKTLLSKSEVLPSGLFKSIGVANVGRRIEYMYGEKYRIRVDSELDSYTSVIVTLPYKKEAGHEL
jgi:Predicted signal transduction protein with a C-terminal ATPase domain